MRWVRVQKKMTFIEKTPAAGTPTIGIDVGGTFTDFVLHLPDGRMLFHKQPSTPRDPSEAVQKGLESLFDREPALRGALPQMVGLFTPPAGLGKTLI